MVARTVGREQGGWASVPPRGALCPLTPRELALLAGAAEGYTNQELAAQLRNSPQTVKNQLAQVLEKLGAPNRTAAVVLALQLGWINLHAVRVRRRAPAALSAILSAT